MSSTPADHQPPSWIRARIADLVRRITPDCREVTRLSSEERDHPLPFVTRTRLGLHRAFCQHCARYAAQLEVLHDAARVLPEHLEKLDRPALKADAKERLKRALQEQGTD